MWIWTSAMEQLADLLSGPSLQSLTDLRTAARIAVGLKARDAGPQAFGGGVHLRLNLRELAAFGAALFKLHVEVTAAAVVPFGVAALLAVPEAFAAALTAGLNA